MSPPGRRTATYRCPCGHELARFGSGRHRIYFEVSDAGFVDPVMTGVCPTCQQVLPGKRAV